MTMLTDQMILQAVLRQDLASFIAKVFPVVVPGTPFLPNWHLDLLADRLTQCYEGRIKRLIITVPPRSLKSICASVAFPAWVLGHDPTCRIICASYAADLAIRLARDCRSVMNTDWYRQLFPQTRLRRSPEGELETTRHGMRYATSVGGTLTGLGGSMLILDDPMKPQEALSKAKREAVLQWYDHTLYSRLDNKAHDCIILVMQRLHVDDLVAHVREKETWEYLNLQAVAESHEIYQLADGRTIERAAGAALHSEREPLAVLETIRETIGTFNFSAQYQQRPVPEEGNLVKWAWFQMYDAPPVLEPGDRIVQSWDTANKTTELSDYSVCTTWQVKGSRYYLVDLFRARLDYPGLKHAVITQARQYPVYTILIEDTALGTALIQEFRYHTQAGVPPPIGVSPKGEKAMRLATQSAAIEAGRVFLPRRARWLDDFRSELMAFPQSRHDDQVDSLSQFLTWITDRQRHRVGSGTTIGMY
jgi:predicted phage terminase large subunit-like protein